MDLGKVAKDVLGFIAPVITAALPGPFGNMAKDLLAPILGLQGEDARNDEKIAEALNNITPEKIAAIRQAEQSFQLEMKKAGYANEEALEKIAADDRASARNREIQVRDNTPRNLAYIYAAGFFLVLGAEIFISVARFTIEPSAARSIDILLGVLVGMVLGTKEFYFGSSSSSRKKDDVISGIAKSA